MVKLNSVVFVEFFNIRIDLSEFRKGRLIDIDYCFFESYFSLLEKSIKFWILDLLWLLLLFFFLLLYVHRASHQVSMEPFHGLSLWLVHFKIVYDDFILVDLTTWLHLVSNVYICSTPCESLLQQFFVVSDFEFVCCKAKFMILESSLLFSRK